jgi:hypothetical protein
MRPLCFGESDQVSITSMTFIMCRPDQIPRAAAFGTSGCTVRLVRRQSGEIVSTVWTAQVPKEDGEDTCEANPTSTVPGEEHPNGDDGAVDQPCCSHEAEESESDIF